MSLERVLVCLACAPLALAQTLGQFESHSDVGTVLTPGAAQYDASKRAYTVSGSGENMWAAADGFQFVWKKVSGDIALTADIAFVGQGGEAHRKAVLMVRQSLDTDSAYADAALHGNGLTSLQAREEKGAQTHEVQSNLSAPRRLRIEKRGRYVYLFLGQEGGEPRFSGASMRVPIEGSFYIGLGVCAHNKDRVETAVFSSVTLAAPAAVRDTVLYSTLETVPVASTDRRVTYVARERIEAPVWSSDGASLLFKVNGRIQRVPVEGGKPETVETGYPVAGEPESYAAFDEFNNWYPHPSPDGRRVVILSCDKSVTGLPKDTDVLLRVFSLPDKRTTVLARLIGGQGTIGASPWSPDGRRIAFVSYHRVPRQ